MVRLTDRPDMTLDVYRGRKTTIQQQQQPDLPQPGGSYEGSLQGFVSKMKFVKE